MNIKEISNIVKPVPSSIKRPLWSVMIPTFNPKEQFIIPAINSVISQDPGPEIMQIEIVDDCSTKVDIPKIIDENWKGRVGYYRLPKNVGHSFNFTESVRRAKGELVHLLHDDDKVKPGFYTKFESIFKKYEDAGAVFCRQEYIDDDDTFMFYSEPEMEETGILADALIRLAEKQRIQYCAMVVRRKVYEELGGYIPKNIGCEDWEMWVRIAAHFQIGYEAEALAQYRIHRTSMTLTDMRTGQDMRFLREAADIFTQYLPEEKRDEVTLFRNKHYAVYSFNNAKRMYEEFNDEVGAAAQLSETIILDSELIYENLDFLSKFNIPIESTGVSVIINSQNDEELIEITLRNLIRQRVPKYIPWEIIIVDNSSTDNSIKAATDTFTKYNSKIPFKIIELKNSSVFEARKTAIENSRYNYIVFCDPGNLLKINYVETVSKKMLQYVNAGAIGGITEAISNINLPEWFEDWSNFCYQIGEQFEYAGNITWTRGYLWSAGIAIRKKAWESIAEKKIGILFSEAKNKTALSGIISEICYGLRLYGWEIIYNFDLKLKIFITESDANWRHLRKIWKQFGMNSVLLQTFQKLKPGDVRNNNVILKETNKRKLIKENYRRLRKYKDWKLISYSETLEGDIDILRIEYLVGTLKELIKSFSTYNEKVKILKRILRKKDFKYFKIIFEKPFSRFPQYKRKNDRRGISVIVNYQSTSFNLLERALDKISKQILNKDFFWEVVIISRFIPEDISNKLLKFWKESNCPADLKIETITSLKINNENLRDLAIEKSKFEYLLFLNETDFIHDDYLRIAYKVISKNKRAGIIGGQAALKSDVRSPNWFDKHKAYYSIGSPFVESGDITDKRGYLWNSGIVARKKALRELRPIGIKLTSEKNNNSHSELNYDFDLSVRIKLAGWRILYEHRLKLSHFITVNKFKWEYLRKLYYHNGAQEIRESHYLNLLNCGNEITIEKPSLYNAGKTLLELNKYPIKKIFSGYDEFNGDEDVLQIEKLKGKFKELISNNAKNDELIKDLKTRINRNGSGKAITLVNGTEERGDKKKGVSIVICCYNSAKILPLTLRYIFRQEVPENVPWEIVIVDNASTDNTSSIAQNIYNKYNCLAPLRIVKEPNPGLSEARQKGFKTAKYEYIIFCDDDNLLNNDFVKLVYEIMSTNEEIGVLGGQGKAEFDVSPSSWFKDWKNSFAVGKQSDTNGDITWTRGYVWGASMVVRKEGWRKLQSKGFKLLLADRKGNALSAGGDTEICYALRNAGWKIWYDSRLKYKHHLPIDRLNWIYLRKLFRGFGQASAGLDVYIKNSPKNYRDKNEKLIPKSIRQEIHKTLSTLRSIRYKKLLSFKRKREGDSDIPMIEYCLGRLESLLKTRRTYNRGIKLLKKTAHKKDLPYLSYVFKDYNNNFPRFKTIKKLNGVSVIICSYNGAERLGDTIRHLALQKINKDILWEVILVDNASTDNSKEVTIKEWSKHKCRAKLKVIDQPIPGKQQALEKGYEVARYEYLITCDDDNWLDENFVQLTYETMSSNDKIGTLGGPNEPLCEVDPPEWFTYFQRDYAAGPQGDIHTGLVSEGNITWKRGYVWGAGMIVRKGAWEKLKTDGFKTSMSCRKGTELTSGGDSEACYALVLAGWEVWYDPRLKLKHCMPAGRLDWNYLVRLFVGFGVASVGLGLYEKAIQLGKADIIDEEIKKQDWKYEFKKTITALRKYGLKKILSLRFSQENNTDILMLEFNISRIKELFRVRKEYDKDFEELINAPWKKKYIELKANHRKYIESENDFRYGWPWSEEPPAEINGSKTFPKISILSPSFNSVGTIEKAILSVLKQGYPNFEHIICDGGSSDGTVEILKKYPHLKWVSETDKGQSDAMNKAFEMSDGDIIVYLNVDDYFQRGAFFKVSKAFEENTSAEMVVGNLLFDFANHTFTRKPEIEYKKIMLPFLYMFPINPVSYFYKRNVQAEIGSFPIDNHFTMDYWFLLKAYQNHKLVKIEDFLGTFCMNGCNKTSNADNRKNTHHRVLYHCWNYDKKLLPFYLYNYYKFFYYDTKPYNLNTITKKLKKNASRIYSLLTLKKNKYYSQKLFERSRYKYHEKKRVRSSINGVVSFLIYPKSIFQRSRQSQFIYSILGTKYSEKTKMAYFFFTTPPGLPLANKLHYFGNQFKNNKKSIRGNSLLMLTYIISPNFIFKKGKHINRPAFYYLNPLNWVKGFLNFFRYKKYKKVSKNFYNTACEKYYLHKNFQAVLLLLVSFMIYPLSVKMNSRSNLFCYSVLGKTLSEKLVFAKHLYKDNPEYSFAHKLNYYGNELRKQNSTFKGNLVLILTYILSPKYILKRERIKKSNIVYVSNFIQSKRKLSLNSSPWASRSINNLTHFRFSAGDIGTGIRNFNEKLKYRIKSWYHYFKYRKYKAKSKLLYSRAIENYKNKKRLDTILSLIPSYLLYPVSILNRNKMSLMINSILGDSIKKKGEIAAANENKKKS